MCATARRPAAAGERLRERDRRTDRRRRPRAPPRCASAGIGEQLVERQVICASTPPAGRLSQLEAAAEALQRRARQQQPDAEAVLLRRDDLEPDVVAHAPDRAPRPGPSRPSSSCVPTHRTSDVDAPAAVRAASRGPRCRARCESLARSWPPRRSADRLPAASNSASSSISGCASPTGAAAASRNALSSTWRAPALRSASTPPAMRFSRSLMTRISSSIARSCAFCSASVDVSSSSSTRIASVDSGVLSSCAVPAASVPSSTIC